MGVNTSGQIGDMCKTPGHGLDVLSTLMVVMLSHLNLIHLKTKLTFSIPKVNLEILI